MAGAGELSLPQGASATCSAPGMAVFALPNLAHSLGLVLLPGTF